MFFFCFSKISNLEVTRGRLESQLEDTQKSLRDAERKVEESYDQLSLAKKSVEQMVLATCYICLCLLVLFYKCISLSVSFVIIHMFCNFFTLGVFWTDVSNLFSCGCILCSCL